MKFRLLFEKAQMSGDLKSLQSKLTKAGLSKKNLDLLKNIIELNNNGDYTSKTLLSNLKKLKARVKKDGIAPKQGLEKLENMIKVLEG